MRWAEYHHPTRTIVPDSVPPMPPLTGIDEALLDPAALAAAKKVAERVHLTHCCSRKDKPNKPDHEQRIQFPTILGEFNWELPLSGDADSTGRKSCGEAALFAEKAFCQKAPDFPERKVIYCYVGRVDPRYGRVALAFHWAPEQEPNKIHWATPFDTGGMVVDPQYVDPNYPFPLVSIAPADVPGRVEYTFESKEEAGAWRERFALWLAKYYPTDAHDYWDATPEFDPVSGELLNRPEADDPDELYPQVAARAAAAEARRRANSNPAVPVQPPPTATAWTWEVMLKGKVLVDECEHWCADERMTTEIRDWLSARTGTQSPDAVARRQAFRLKDCSPSKKGTSDYADELERVIRDHAFT